MNYIKIINVSHGDGEAVTTFCELDDTRREVRKVEVFADGSLGFASVDESSSARKTSLSELPHPSLEEIAANKRFNQRFVVMSFDAEKFAMIWSVRTQGPNFFGTSEA